MKVQIGQELNFGDKNKGIPYRNKQGESIFKNLLEEQGFHVRKLANKWLILEGNQGDRYAGALHKGKGKKLTYANVVKLLGIKK